MSVSIKYKGAEIASASTEVTKTIKTSGKYCEADIVVENTPDGGITPSGKKLITDTSETDVAAFATAQVSSDTLLAENIKKDVNILGIVGSFEGGGGGGDPVINPLSVTANGTYTAPSGVDGYSPVTVNVPQGIIPTGKITIAENGTDIDVAQYALADVNVSGGGGAQIATGSITPTENVKYLDITGLNFTPKAMAVLVAPEFRNTGIQMTGGAICIYDLALISRSNTGGTSTLASWSGASVAGASDKSITTCTVVNSFSYTSGYVERKSDAFRVTLYSDNMNFPYASGVKYDWIAIG